MPSPEERARQLIDHKLDLAGWAVQDRRDLNLAARRGVAVREFPLAGGEADYVLFVDRQALGVIEAKPMGATLSGVAEQSTAYATGAPGHLPHVTEPLPFVYESTGVETYFRDLRDPDSRSRPLYAFHRPETLADWACRPGILPGPSRAEPGRMPGLQGDALGREGPGGTPGVQGDAAGREAPGKMPGVQASTLRGRLREMPPLITSGLRDCQVEAIRGLERSLAQAHPRALIQMATGSGKTYAAVTAVYRLIKHARARRVLYLVDRNNLGKQALAEFQQYVTPDDGRKFTELYNVQHLTSNALDPVSKVCITTIQRLYSMLCGEPEYDPEMEERSLWDLDPQERQPRQVTYNPAIPIETFDFIITDECHRSIYNLWRQVLEYFDAFLTGLTATPSKQTLGFFNQNLVTEYPHERAVADGVNVGYEVYRIRTQITEQGSRVEAGHTVDKRDRLTRARRWEQLDDELVYEANQLDRDVVAPDQIRTVIETFRDRLYSDIFPGRKEVPKTLIFAKDDSHAEDIVHIVRDLFGKGNDFCKKITYKTTGESADALIRAFRTAYNPRIAVTVDMISTGTDIRPLECLIFMRDCKSRVYYDQMKGRGTRTISPTDLQAVTPGVAAKTHFVIVDAVGVTERLKTETRTLERKKSVPFDKLLEWVALGNRDEDTLSSLAGRLARLDREVSDAQREEIASLAGGATLKEMAHALLDAIDPDLQIAEARARYGAAEPTEEQLAQAAEALAEQACAPLNDPALRHTLESVRQSVEQIIDIESQDTLLSAGRDAQAQERARSMVESFRRFIAENRDELTALQLIYSRPYGQRRLTYEHIKELAAAISKPPYGLTPERLWQAYEQLEASKVRRAGPEKLLTNMVSLVRYALGQSDLLEPYPLAVNERYERWIEGKRFTPEQRAWLEMIRDHIAASLAVSVEDFEYAPFFEKGGPLRVYQLFGAQVEGLLAEMNEVLAA